jgi:hypothetical protein
MGKSPLVDSAATIAAFARSLGSPYHVLVTKLEGQALMAKKIADLDKSPPQPRSRLIRCEGIFFLLSSQLPDWRSFESTLDRESPHLDRVVPDIPVEELRGDTWQPCNTFWAQLAIFAARTINGVDALPSIGASTEWKTKKGEPYSPAYINRFRRKGERPPGMPDLAGIRNSQQVEHPDALAVIAATVNRVARDQGDLVVTTTGREFPRDEFTDEDRPTGEWADICMISDDTFRNRMDESKPGPTWRIVCLPSSNYIVHLEDLPSDIRGSQRLRDDRLRVVRG